MQHGFDFVVNKKLKNKPLVLPYKLLFALGLYSNYYLLFCYCENIKLILYHLKLYDVDNA